MHCMFIYGNGSLRASHGPIRHSQIQLWCVMSTLRSFRVFHHFQSQFDSIISQLLCRESYISFSSSIGCAKASRFYKGFRAQHNQRNCSVVTIGLACTFAKKRRPQLIKSPLRGELVVRISDAPRARYALLIESRSTLNTF